MIQSWRIVDEDFLGSAFSGEGARLVGGRWNSEGMAIVYTAETLSLSLLEIIVHLEIKHALHYFKVIPISFEEQWVQKIPRDELPLLWHAVPPCFATKTIGDLWVKDALAPILRVPSAVVPQEFNYLFNPNHPDFAVLQIGKPIDLPLDPRIATKLNP